MAETAGGACYGAMSGLLTVPIAKNCDYVYRLETTNLILLVILENIACKANYLCFGYVDSAGGTKHRYCDSCNAPE